MLYENALGLLAAPLHTVATTSLTKLREDVDELRRSWATALSSLSFFAMPAFAILAVTAPDVMVLLLGQKWAMAGSLLSIFAFRGIAHWSNARWDGFTWRLADQIDGCDGESPAA